MAAHGERRPRHEQQHSTEQRNVSDEAHNAPEHTKHPAEVAEHDTLQHSVEALKARADREAKSAHEFDTHDTDTAPSQSFGLHRDLKRDAYQHSLQKARRHLSTPEQLFSKAIHHPTIDTASEIAANTIGRTSGLFTGSLFALIGSAFLLYMSKKYGFTYNYGVFLLCFLGGFALGLLVELIWRAIRKKQ